MYITSVQTYKYNILHLFILLYIRQRMLYVLYRQLKMIPNMMKLDYL